MHPENPWLARRRFAWAHQGGAKEGPSNTLLAMTRAMDAGADGLELDVHRTKDGRLVVCHDEDLERTTNGTGRIADHTLEQLQRLDAAYVWIPGSVVAPGRPDADYPLRHRGDGPVPRETSIPTLEEVFEAFPGVPLNLELKEPGYAQELADAIAASGRDDIIVVSFHDRALRELRTVAPHVATAPGLGRLAWFWLASRFGRAARLPAGTVAVQLPHRLKGITVIDRKSLAAAARRGVAVHAWTIDDEAEMDELLALGVEGIMSDRPAVLAQRTAASGGDAP